MKRLQNNNDFIAYHHLEGRADKPGVVFMGGFMSDMEGSKAVFLQEFCQQHDLQYTRFDYFGHGESTGDFTDGTITRWHEDALLVLDKITVGKQVFVGSSMGGWIALLCALARPERLHSLVGIAAAPDFTEDLIWHQLTNENKEMLRDVGVVNIPSCYDDGDPYPITMKLIEDGRKHLLLGGTVDINCPVRLLHGMQDQDVPYQTTLEITKQLETDDVQILLSKAGDHRMSDEVSLNLLGNVLQEATK